MHSLHSYFHMQEQQPKNSWQQNNKMNDDRSAKGSQIRKFSTNSGASGVSHPLVRLIFERSKPGKVRHFLKRNVAHCTTRPEIWVVFVIFAPFCFVPRSLNAHVNMEQSAIWPDHANARTF